MTQDIIIVNSRDLVEFHGLSAVTINDVFKVITTKVYNEAKVVLVESAIGVKFMKNEINNIKGIQSFETVREFLFLKKFEIFYDNII